MDTVQQVWDRVLAPARPGVRGLGTLLAGAEGRRRAYRRWLTGAQGVRRQLLQELEGQETRTVQALGGMLALTREGRSLEAVKTPGSLEQCFRESTRAAGEYTALWGDPELGGAFQTLAEQQRQQCVRILRLMGM